MRRLKSEETGDLKEDPELSMARGAGGGGASAGGDGGELLMRAELVRMVAEGG